MPRLRSAPPAKAKKGFVLQKPNGLLTPRVQAVGPEHFGILAIDCAKARSRYFLADFYGRVLLEPTTLPHQRGDLQAAVDRVRQAMRQHHLADLVVAIERTGEYHRPVQLAFRQAGFETRLVHPFTSKHYRQPADPGNKTDDTDLAAICRATTHGFGLLEPTWPDDYVTLQLLRRHRRDLVDKTTILQCQIREVLHAAMPGYAECFCHLWDDSPAPMLLARATTSAQAVRQAGVAGLEQIAVQAGLHCRADTFHKILAWATQAPPDAGHTADRRRILTSLDDDRRAKNREILELERHLAHQIVHTPLRAAPGHTRHQRRRPRRRAGAHHPVPQCQRHHRPRRADAHPLPKRPSRLRQWPVAAPRPSPAARRPHADRRQLGALQPLLPGPRRPVDPR